MYKDKTTDDSRVFDEKLTITVYTTDTCLFCKKALEIVRETVEKTSFPGHLEIVEQDLQDEHSLHKEINTLPAIKVGDRVFVGIPSSDDVEDLIALATITDPD